jgi:hypothetical protein
MPQNLSFCGVLRDVDHELWRLAGREVGVVLALEARSAGAAGVVFQHVGEVVGMEGDFDRIFGIDNAIFAEVK